MAEGPGTQFLKSLAAKAATATPKPPACDIKSALRSEVEAWLQSFGVKYTGPVEVPLSSIDVKESRAHQQRATPIVEDTVQGVRSAIDRGEYIKPVVMFIDGNKANLIDGNNRDEAHRREGRSFIEAYVVDSNTPSATIGRMLVAANSHHPERPDLAWRVKSAARLMAAFGVSKEQACVDANIKPAQLDVYLKTKEADKRAEVLKIRDWKSIPDTGRRALHRISMDAPFHAAARVALEEPRMRTDEIDQFSKDIRQAGKSEAAMLSVIEHVRAQREMDRRSASAGVTRMAATASANLNTALGKLLKVDPVQLASSVLTDVDRRILLNKIEQALDHLGVLEAALAVKKAM